MELQVSHNEEEIEILAEIEDTALFGKDLKVIRKISTALMLRYGYNKIATISF